MRLTQHKHDHDRARAKAAYHGLLFLSPYGVGRPCQRRRGRRLNLAYGSLEISNAFKAPHSDGYSQRPAKKM